MEIVGELLQHKDIQDLKYYKHHYYNTRFAHSLEVSYTTYRWCKRLGLDYRAGARAGLMHDMFYYDCRESRGIIEHHNRDHPLIALMNARQLTELTEIEEDMILKHMWVPFKQTPEYTEGWVITLADKYHAMMDWVYIPIKKRMKQHAEVYARRVDTLHESVNRQPIINKHNQSH